MKKMAVLVLGALFVLGLTGGAEADIFTATDNDWTITFDTQRQAEGGIYREGLIGWEDPFGNDHIWEGSWWGRGNDGEEGPLSGLTLLSGFNPNPNEIVLQYVEPDGNLYVDLWYSLTGNGEFSTIAEKAVLTNLNNSQMSLSIFEYSDFNLTGTDDDDTAFLNMEMQGIMQYDDLTGVLVTPVSPTPKHFQIAEFPSLVDALSDGVTTTLTDSGSPYGPGDAAFAFQWDFTLAPDGGTYTIDKMNYLKTTAPEPLSCALFLVGGGAMCAARRLRKGRS